CRSAYAQAILKTHVVGLVAALECRWESRTASSLERRFKMLKKVAPGPIRAITGHFLVCAFAAVATGFAWADQPQERNKTRAHAISLEQLNASGALLVVDGRRESVAEVSKIPPRAIARIELLPKNDAKTIALFGPDAKKGGVIHVILIH